ncbi:hypothetical protein HK102_005076 [Quaeritorhiza haematococci]|nr:hypothetical protein HK102_005076 [Quaeritorhiza haematococci]
MGDAQRHATEEAKHHAKEIDVSSLKPGTKVEYHPVGTAMQTTTGTVKQVLTHDDIAGNTHKHIHASEEEPRIVIENDRTHKETAYKRENIVRVVGEGEGEKGGKESEE